VLAVSLNQHLQKKKKESTQTICFYLFFNPQIYSSLLLSVHIYQAWVLLELGFIVDGGGCWFVDDESIEKGVVGSWMKEELLLLLVV